MYNISFIVTEEIDQEKKTALQRIAHVPYSNFNLFSA